MFRKHFTISRDENSILNTRVRIQNMEINLFNRTTKLLDNFRLNFEIMRLSVSYGWPIYRSLSISLSQVI